MNTISATYSPDDDKLRIYPAFRLSDEEYKTVKAAGFQWAPKQECFYAVWTPAREDVALEMAEEIYDEDKDLQTRAAERAERFEAYSSNRARDAEAAQRAVHAIADHIPFGQPILVGHHSEKHHRRDIERMDSGMRRAVANWKTSEYWKYRAASALEHAQYKELPDVRHRRIKGLESELRKVEKGRAEALKVLALWAKVAKLLEAHGETEEVRAFATKVAASSFTFRLCLTKEHSLPFYQEHGYAETAYDALTRDDDKPQITVALLCEIAELRRVHLEKPDSTSARWVAHLSNRIAYERAMLQESGDIAASKFDIQPGGMVNMRHGWAMVIRVNKDAAGNVTSVTTDTKYVPVRGIEEVTDYRPPTEETKARVQRITALPPLCNYPGEGFAEMTKAEWAKIHRDYKGTDTIKATDTTAAHRVRYGARGGWKRVYITDEKRKDPPAIEEQPR